LGFVFTLLVGDAAAGLAGGLAGSLAFAAASVLRAFAKGFGRQSLDVLHFDILQIKQMPYYNIRRGSSQSISKKLLQKAERGLKKKSFTFVNNDV
jgi:hypothetical protein